MRFLAALAVCALAVVMSACSTIPGVPSVTNEGQSPRKTTVAAIEGVVIPAFEKLTLVATLGALPDNFLDDVVQFAPDLEARASAYLDATAPCVTIDGVLQTDPALGRPCHKSELDRAYFAVSDMLAEAVQRAGPGSDTGRGLIVLSLFLDRQLRPSSSDVWSGYERRPDLTLEEFDAARAALRVSFERLVTAAKAALDAPADS